MKGKWYVSAATIIAALTVGLSNSVIAAKSSTRLSESEALKLGLAAYIYGYPLITMDLTKQVLTNVVEPEKNRGPAGRFIHLREYPNPIYHDVTTPNADTLYSFAWINLANGPYVMHVPNEDGRYYLMPILDGWTNVFAAPGSRTTGSNEQNFLIVGPGWKGEAPKGMRVYQSATNMAWIIGRTYCTGTPEDYALVHAIQDQYKLVPLSEYGKEYTPPAGIVNPEINMKTPVRAQVNALDADTYFKRLNQLMKDNPPTSADKPIMTQLAKIGVAPGKEFDIDKMDPVVAKALKKAVEMGPEAIKSYGNSGQAGELRNGWVYSLKTGSYGTDYLQRAFVTVVGFGANLPQDAIYPFAETDIQGKKLNGANKYVLHFEKNKMPPVKGFWSLTMYDDKLYFVENTLNKYRVSQRDGLVVNKNGSVDIYIQHDSPGADKETNWLPAPEGEFVLVLRLYWPTEAIISGKWLPPGLRRNPS